MHDPIILYIIVKRTSNLDNMQIAYCAASAVEQLMIKYFTLQLLAVKSNNEALDKNPHLTTTTKWLASHSRKCIVPVDDEIWDKIQNEFNVGKDFFYIKNVEKATTMVFWPLLHSQIPDYLK